MTEINSAADRAAVKQLTVDYCWALDTADWEALRQVFLPDVVADLGAGGQNGVDEIIARVSTALARLDDSQHMVTNHQINVDGDRATCRCYLQAQHIRHTDGDDQLYMVGARYEDVCTRTAEGWRIAERKLVIMWTEGTRDVFGPR